MGGEWGQWGNQPVDMTGISFTSPDLPVLLSKVQPSGRPWVLICKWEHMNYISGFKAGLSCGIQGFPSNISMQSSRQNKTLVKDHPIHTLPSQRAIPGKVLYNTIS